jgi:hypothetical protein
VRRGASAQSVVDPPCGGTCCPLCGKAGTRLVAFTDATGVLHIVGVDQCLAIPPAFFGVSFQGDKLISDEQFPGIFEEYVLR